MRRLATILLVLSIPLATLAAGCSDDDLTGIEEDAEFVANLSGAAERPDPVTTDASGTAFFDVDGTTVRYQIEVEDIENVTVSHIHVGGTQVAGPIVVELFNSGGNPQSFTDREMLVQGTFDVSDIQAADGIVTLNDLLAAMEAGNTYVNVHTTQNAPGEIRGQIQEL